MGRELSESFTEAREVFERVDESLGRALSAVIFNGPEEDLNLTENTQPALMVVSMAVMAVLKKQGGFPIDQICSFVAGHSLGEYSALTAAEALTLEDTARLLDIRGRAMQQAVPVGQGAMAAILGLEFSAVQAIAAQAAGTETCMVANDNSTGQVVVSGHKGAVETAIALASEQGAKRAIALPVSAPFHCTLMEPAARAMREALAETTIQAPCVPVVTNITAQAESDPEALRRLLVEQVTGMVRWRESVLWMAKHGVMAMVELGAGKVLSGLVRRIDKTIDCESIGTPEAVEALIAKLSS